MIFQFGVHAVAVTCAEHILPTWIIFFSVAENVFLTREYNIMRPQASSVSTSRRGDIYLCGIILECHFITLEATHVYNNVCLST